MPRREGLRHCSRCYVDLPHGRRIYAEISSGWTVEHESGGAHNVAHAGYTGRILCGLCFDRQRPAKVRPIVPALCTECGEGRATHRQIVYAWVPLPATKSVHDARYGPLHLCRPCWLKAMGGQQMALFDQ